MRWNHRRAIITGSIGALTLTAAAALPAAATTGTATITAGSLTFVSSPPNVSFSVTLNGLDQTVSANEAIDLGDATGSGAGWNLQATSTTFNSGAHTLSTAATTMTGVPSDACDGGATCSLANNAIAYPYVLPAGAVAPLATKFYDAAINSGMGDQTATATWRLTVPASTFAGTYTSTWTITLASAP